jgi:protein-disulfide isomerase
VLAGRTGAAPDPAVLNPMIESYLMSDPRVLQRLSSALDVELRAEARTQAKVALAAAQTELYESPDDAVLGNPEGDVTLIEFFDYNCGYCRSALPDLATLLAEDPGLKVILKEYPILSNQSIEAARVGLLVAKQEADYWLFHQALFTSRGTVDGKVALAEAQKLGLSPIHIELDMQSGPVNRSLEKTMDLAQRLGINGTPTYVIGDEIVPGAVGIDSLRRRIANLRACGSTECPAPIDTAPRAGGADSVPLAMDRPPASLPPA